MKKKYLFILMIINIFFITNVKADTFPVEPSLPWFYAGTVSNGNVGVGWNLIGFVGTPYYEVDLTNISMIRKISIQYNLADYDYDYVVFNFMGSFTYTGGNSWSSFITADLDELNCTNDNTIVNGNNNFFSFTCRNPKKNGVYLNINSNFNGTSHGGTFRVKQNVGFFNDLQTAISEQHHQEIMENDSTSYNNGIESIAGNTQLPNNSGLFDVLSSLSNFVGSLSASGTCNAITVPIPFTTQNLRLPCMTSEVYAPNFPEILVIWQLIVRGIVYYYIIVNLLKLLKDTIDPFSMKLEVLDL